MKNLHINLASIKRKAIFLILIIEVLSLLTLTAQDGTTLAINAPGPVVLTPRMEPPSAWVDNPGKVPSSDDLVMPPLQDAQIVFEAKVINNPGSIFDPVRIEFDLKENRFIDARIFDMRGKEVYKKRLGFFIPGRQRFELNTEGLNTVGNYVLVLFAEDQTSTMIMVRM